MLTVEDATDAGIVLLAPVKLSTITRIEPEVVEADAEPIVQPIPGVEVANETNTMSVDTTPVTATSNAPDEVAATVNEALPWARDSELVAAMIGPTREPLEPPTLMAVASTSS